MNTPDPARSVDARAAPRASLFLAASLHCDGTPYEVKIRNISSTGALLDGAVGIQAEAIVQLVRGTLIGEGVVAWVSGGKCGLHFSREVDVEKWCASLKNTDQHLIDETVRLIKSKSRAGALPSPQNMQPPFTLDMLSFDLRKVSELLEHLGDKLAKDGIVVAQYPAQLQHVDIAMQLIAAVEKILVKGICTQEDEAKMISLRRSAALALRTS